MGDGALAVVSQRGEFYLEATLDLLWFGIAAIYGIGAALFRESRWTTRRTPARLCATALLGLAGAVTVEKLALRLDWWAYGPAMPRVPGTDLGISPLVQFILLPLIVLFWMLPRLWSRRKTS